MIKLTRSPFQPVIGLMTLLPQADLPTATSISVFFQFFGGAIFLNIGENIFVSSLVKNLHKYAPNVDATLVVNVGAAGLRKVVKAGADLEGSLLAYDAAITRTFFLCAAGAVLGFFCSFGMEWGSVKGKQNRGVVPEVVEKGAEEHADGGEEAEKTVVKISQR